jgi:epoxyqueuosine reductase
VAEAAGIGAVGKNTMLIQQGVGSWILLGEIVTTLEIQSNAAIPADPCGTCTRCIDACPTDALSPFAMDATRCISYLTIEHRDVIDRTLHAGMGEWIFGCDICQEVCPHNQPTVRTEEAAVEPSSGSRAGALALLEVLNWSAEDRIAAVGGTSATRAKLDMWRRNAAIALRNAGVDVDTAARLDAIAADADEVEMVRDAAAT